MAQSEERGRSSVIDFLSVECRLIDKLIYVRNHGNGRFDRQERTGRWTITSVPERGGRLDMRFPLPPSPLLSAAHSISDRLVFLF